MRPLYRVLALAVVVLAAGLYLTQVSGVNADEKTEPKLRGQLYPNWKKLGLSEEQIQKIYKVQNEYQVKIDKLEAEIKALKKEEVSKAEALLTTAQKARLKELKTGEPETPEKGKP